MMGENKKHHFTKLKDFLKAIEAAETLGQVYRMSRYIGEEDQPYWVLTIVK